MSTVSQGARPALLHGKLARRFFWAAAAAAALALAGWTTPAFLTLDNLFVVVRAASTTGVVAIGMSYVTISGNLFALSAGQLSALLGIVYALLVRAGAGAPAACGATLVAAAGAGAAQGYAMTIVRNPIITTIAFGAVFAGIAALISGNGNIRLHNEIATWIGTMRPLRVPIQSWVFVAWALVSAFIVAKTRVGRLLTLSGENRLAAQASGLRVDRAAAFALAMLGVSCAIVAIFSVSQFSQAKADMFSGLDIDCIASVLVGGVALRGGRGSPVQAALGAALIALLQNFLLLRALPSGVRFAIVGALVVAATSGFHLLQRRER
ncbi:MAG TPA: ABC transporter permease [Roseiarcus sp.]|nr:ABC transporter permease [Roseiarcus sp.]